MNRLFFVGARKPEQVQQVHELIAPEYRPFSLVRFCPSVFRASPNWEPGKTCNNNKSNKKANANLLEQEPDAISNVTIVA
jgi:hypothetical protein